LLLLIDESALNEVGGNLGLGVIGAEVGSVVEVVVEVVPPDLVIDEVGEVVELVVGVSDAFCAKGIF